MGFQALRGRPPDFVQVLPVSTLTESDASGVATFVGAALFAAVLASSGTGSASFVGASVTNAPLAATGAGTATFVGAATTNAVLSVADAAGGAPFIAPTPPAPIFWPPALQKPYVFGPGLGFQYRMRPPDAVPATTSGITTLSVPDAFGTAAFVGASLSPAPLSAAGTGTATFVGASLDAGVLSVPDPAGTATFTGAALGSGVLASAGAGVASWVGSSISGNTLTESDAAGSAAFIGNPAVSATWGSDIGGAGTPSWVGASLDVGTLSAAGTGTASLTGSINGALSASGAGVASFTGASLSSAPLSAAGIGTAQWFGPGGAGGGADMGAALMDLPEITATGMMGGGDSGGLT